MLCFRHDPGNSALDTRGGTMLIGWPDHLALQGTMGGALLLGARNWICLPCMKGRR